MTEDEARAAAKAFAQKYDISEEAEAELARLLESTWNDGFDSVATNSGA